MSDTERRTSVAPRATAGQKEQSYNAQFTTAQIKNALQLDTANTHSGTKKRLRSTSVSTDFQQKVVPAKKHLIAAAQQG